MTNEIQSRTKELHSLIERHNKKYYGDNTSVISDAEYDKLYQELEQLEKSYPELITPSSPTQRVSGVVSKQFKSHKHSVPMLSLKTETDYSARGAINFHERIKKELNTYEIEYVCEPKYDGLGVDLEFIDGKLVCALTRGDGITGEDVTNNVRQIKDIPHFLKGPESVRFDMIKVRGEIFMKKSVFNEYNAGHEKKLANTRNAAAGSIRQLNSNVTRSRNLSFFPYSVPDFRCFKNDTPVSQYGWLKLLKSMGFCLNPLIKIANSADELISFHDEIEKIRSSLDYDIDGVVYKVNNLALQTQIGFISREPKWAVAHKFFAEEKETIVTAIDVQVGRTGKLTPVARVEPVFVSGTTINNVTLHNEQEANRKDVRVGDRVIVRRAGDVIPEIVQTVALIGKERSEPFKMPAVCPSCGTPVVKIEVQADHRCPNTIGCPDQNKYSIAHFVQRKAVEIEGLGEKLVEQLIEEGHVKTSADLFCLGSREGAKSMALPLMYFLKHKSKEEIDDLAYKVLLSLDRKAEKSVRNILSAIEKAKETTLEKFIYALGIRNAGEGTAKRLVKNLKTLDAIADASVDQLSTIEDIGPIVASSVYEYFHNKENIENIELLLQLGIKFKQDDMDNRILDGINVVITGSFSTVKRSEAEDRLKQFGANVQGNVGKTTNVLFCGENAGTKLVEATKLGINICYENDLRLAITNPTSWKSLYVR